MQERIDGSFGEIIMLSIILLFASLPLILMALTDFFV